MKVLMFGWEFPPFISGGLGTACYGITKGLKDTGIDIDFVIPKIYKKDGHSSPVHIIDASTVAVRDRHVEQLETDHVNLIEIDSPLRAYMTEDEYSKQLLELEEKQQLLKTHEKATTYMDFVGGYGSKLISEVFRLCKVAEELGRNTDADVIHAHDWVTFPAAIAAKEVSGLPLVVHVHATEFDRNSIHVNQHLYDIERKGMHAADKVIAVSNKTKDTIVTHYGIPKEKVVVVYNAIDKEQFTHSDFLDKISHDPVVLFLGRVTSQKGPGYFLDTARIVLKQMENVHFVMAGSGDMLNEMIQLSARFRINHRFHFTGFLSGKELQQMFSLSDLLIMPSVSEPFGIVPIEAIHNNTPVIISKQSGVSEILPDAITVDFWDTEMFAKHIIDVLKNPSKKQKYLELNKNTIDKLHWNFSALEILDVYKEVIA